MIVKRLGDGRVLAIVMGVQRLAWCGLLTVSACFDDPVTVDDPSDGAQSTTRSTPMVTGSPQDTAEDDATGAATSSTSSGPASPDSSGTSDRETEGAETDGTQTDGPATDGTGPTPVTCLDANLVAFVNFDGVEITEGPTDDAAANVSALPNTSGRWSAYTANDRQAILNTLTAAFAPFDACITDTRPNRGDYTMIVVTPNEHVSGALAFGPEDCNNIEGDRDIAFAFAPVLSFSATAKGYLIASLIAGTVGVGVVTDAPDDIMKLDLETNDGNLSFTRTCYPLSQNTLCFPTTCTGDEQSSFELLTAVVGLAR